MDSLPSCEFISTKLQEHHDLLCETLEKILKDEIDKLCKKVRVLPDSTHETSEQEAIISVPDSPRLFAPDSPRGKELQILPVSFHPQRTMKPHSHETPCDKNPGHFEIPMGTARNHASDDLLVQLSSKRLAWKEHNVSKTQDFTTYISEAVSNNSWKYEFSISVLVILDVAFMGLRAQFMMLDAASLAVALFGDAFFCVAFLGDVCLQLWRKRWGFFHSQGRWWISFDILVTVISLVDVCMDASRQSIDVLPWVRVLRLLRLARAVKFFQEMDFCRELRIMTNTCYLLGRSSLWLFVFTALIVYACGVALCAGASSHCNEETQELDSFALCHHFGSLADAMKSLIQVAFGGLPLRDIADALAPTSPVYSIVLFVFVVLFVYILPGMLIGMIVTIMQQSLAHDLKDIINSETLKENTCIQYLHEVFTMMDSSKSGTVSFDEFELAMQDKNIQAFFKAFNIYSRSWADLFRIFDKRGEGAIEERAFIECFLWLKGAARTADIISLAMPKDADYDNGVSSAVIEARPAQPIGSMNFEKVPLMLVPEKPGSIREVEMRAMTLSEMFDVQDMIINRLQGHEWKDMRTGYDLTPAEVNLYHFNYHAIGPLTALAPENIILEGLSHIEGLDLIGCEVEQHDPTGFQMLPLAVGHVTEIQNNGCIRVVLRRGQFSCSVPLQVCSGSQAGVSLGQPTQVRAPRACSYKELVAKAPLRPRWFISHWWGEQTLKFVCCLEKHALLRHLKGTEASYWVCAFANCQHQLNDEMGEDPECSSFRKAMKLAEGTLLVLDHLATPFKRIWCDFELFKTVTEKRPLDIITLESDEPLLLADQVAMLPKESMLAKTLREQHFPIRLIQMGLRSKLQDGEASVEQDKQRILQSMKDSGVDVSDANSRLHGFLARAVWPQAVKHGKVQSYQLPEILMQDRHRKKLQISLANFAEVGDPDVQFLAQGMPPQLHKVILSFQGCQNVTNLGVGCLGQHLSQLKDLKELKLDFQGCCQITDTGLERLAMGLPQNIKLLELHFDFCANISSKGLQCLARQIAPMGLQFHGTFKSTRINRDFQTKAEIAAAFRSSIQS